jgi:cbb3-type cytochrome oxidase subunit 3
MLKYIKQYAASIEGINIYPLFSLMVFVLFFIAVIYFVRKMDKNRVEEIRNMPLDLQDENNAIVNPIKA